MSPAANTFFKRWLVTTLAVLVAAHVVKGIEYESYLALLAASFVLGVLNAFLRPVLMFLSLPLLFLTLGLFTLFINAALLYAVGWLVKSFRVAGFWPAFWGALVISVVSMVLNPLLGVDKGQPPASRSRLPPRRPDAQGPVIDV
jgi:putative membrane protein